MIDKEKVISLLTDLDEYLNSLNDLQKLTVKEYLSDKRNIYSGRYLLQISIETCINIANHIISRMKLGVPKEYADSFRLLNKNEVISSVLLDKLVLMTRFRNRIVHLYWQIDDSFVFELINNNLNDLLEFKSSINSYLKSIN